MVPVENGSAIPDSITLHTRHHLGSLEGKFEPIRLEDYQKIIVSIIKSINLLRKDYLRVSFNLNIATYVKKFNEDQAWLKVFRKPNLPFQIKSITLKVLADFLEEAPENMLSSSVD